MYNIFHHEHEELLRSAHEVIERLDLCFENDASFTGEVSFEHLSNALLGADVGDGHGCNLENLSNAIYQLRKVLAKQITMDLLSVRPSASS